MQAAKNFIRQQGVNGSYAVYQQRENEQLHYGVVFGRYATRQDVENESTLFRQIKPWIRPLEAIIFLQKALTKINLAFLSSYSVFRLYGVVIPVSLIDQINGCQTKEAHKPYDICDRCQNNRTGNRWIYAELFQSQRNGDARYGRNN